MPKNKTNGAAAKRIKVAKSGKLRRLHAHRKAGAAFASTPLRGRKHRRMHSGMTEVSPADTKRIRRLLGR